jgi:V8-like Glu-specific endopeptidase
MSEWLEYRQLEELITNAIAAELWEPDKRRLLFFRINDLRAKTPRMGNDELQLRADVQFLNSSLPRDGSPPLLTWLQNARPLVASRDEQDYFEKLLAKLEGRPAERVIFPTLVESIKRETILFEDDMLPVGYLQDGVTAARSVARLRVPRFDNGVESNKRYWGTGWLLTPSFLITNHHVFNARDDDDPDATAEDFSRQALSTAVQFDVDSTDGGTEPIKILEVAASDSNLDYAIARLAAPQRPALRVDWSPFSPQPGEVVPLNIIQHPSGQPKKIAIRNNLATRANTPELRYFTATLGGSSGSPVLNDKWQVVGIHRGSIGTKVVTFQGRNSAIINLGTQMAAIGHTLLDPLKRELGCP